ncbi:hypothetical protein [Bacillus sp. AFS017336]|uniref:hypothetical protein n=1 Tax=Bacillus sp. AFS017336 TaxID=2033489 RepID=UPI000BF1F012|nr:hypothetical protein [Bacillus sp. AFS017336]PEL14260.1 hypothetical protein CN601_01565 [Bacillus sp. AFS017336]
MKKKFVSRMTILVVFLCIGLSACQKNKEIVHISIIREGLPVKTIDETAINKIESIFTNVKWNPNTQVNWAKEEDCKIVVTYKQGSKTSKTEYGVWFSGKEAELSSSDSDESYGELNKEDTMALKKIVRNN